MSPVYRDLTEVVLKYLSEVLAQVLHKYYPLFILFTTTDTMIIWIH